MQGDTRGGTMTSTIDSPASGYLASVESAGATAPGLRWGWIVQYVGAGIGLIAGALLVPLAVRRPDRQARV